MALVQPEPQRTAKGYKLTDCWAAIGVRCRECRKLAWAWIAPLGTVARTGNDAPISAEWARSEGSWEKVRHTSPCTHLSEPNTPPGVQELGLAIDAWQTDTGRRQQMMPGEELRGVKPAHVRK